MADSYQVPHCALSYVSNGESFCSGSFINHFPSSLYESAKIDGCGNLRFIFRILLPLTKSAIGAMAVYIPLSMPEHVYVAFAGDRLQ